jgi:hypothetical protein
MSSLPERYLEVDVTKWVHAHEETLGTKPKRWLQDPTSGSYWLMKDTTFNTHADGRRFAKGDDWSERIACGVAAGLELPAAIVELAFARAKPAPRLGVISRSVLISGESLVHGNELLAEIGAGATDPHDRAGWLQLAGGPLGAR